MRLRLQYIISAVLILLGILSGCLQTGQKTGFSTGRITVEADINGDVSDPGLSVTEPGDLITFGNREWRVLALDNGKALIISETLLEPVRFHEDGINRWESSAIRRYLNDSYLDKSFTAKEKAKICATNIITADNIRYRTPAGPDTRDKVFLLSIEEVLEYFTDGSINTGVAAMNDAVLSDGDNSSRLAYTSSGEAAGWWLRTPGYTENDTAFVDNEGRLDMAGSPVASLHYMRPALWIKLEGPALRGDSDPAPEHMPGTYVTENNTYAFDVPYGLVVKTVNGTGTGEYITVESPGEGWTMCFFEYLPEGKYDTYQYQKDLLGRESELSYISVAGREGIYCSRQAPEIFIDIRFPNPVSDDAAAVYGTVWLRMSPIDGYETGDYLEIRNIKAIIESIRIPG